MARLPRLYLAGCAQHVIQYGITLVESEPQGAYRTLFHGRMRDRDLTAIRAATNKGWAPGDERFKALIEAKIGRRSEPVGRGGDRKSSAFREARDR